MRARKGVSVFLAASMKGSVASLYGSETEYTKKTSAKKAAPDSTAENAASLMDSLAPNTDTVCPPSSIFINR